MFTFRINLACFKSKQWKASCPRGFSLVELVTIIAIIGIAAAIAIPNFISWLPNYRLKSATQDLFSNFQLAKMTAIQRNRNCTVVFNQTVAGTAFDYVVFIDINGNVEFDAGEPVITRQLLTAYPGVDFDTTQGGGDGLTFLDNDDGNAAITFRPNAVPTDNNGGVANGSAFFTNTNGRVNSVVVNIAGSISVD